MSAGHAPAGPLVSDDDYTLFRRHHFFRLSVTEHLPLAFALVTRAQLRGNGLVIDQRKIEKLASCMLADGADVVTSSQPQALMRLLHEVADEYPGRFRIRDRVRNAA